MELTHVYNTDMLDRIMVHYETRDIISEKELKLNDPEIKYYVSATKYLRSLRFENTHPIVQFLFLLKIERYCQNDVENE